MPNPNDYFAMKVWLAVSGSMMDYYIQNKQEEAAEDNAPINAVYKKQGTKEYVTTDDLSPNHWFHETLRRSRQKK